MPVKRVTPRSAIFAIQNTQHTYTNIKLHSGADEISYALYSCFHLQHLTHTFLYQVLDESLVAVAHWKFVDLQPDFNVIYVY